MKIRNPASHFSRILPEINTEMSKFWKVCLLRDWVAHLPWVAAWVQCGTDTISFRQCWAVTVAQGALTVACQQYLDYRCGSGRVKYINNMIRKTFGSGLSTVDSGSASAVSSSTNRSLKWPKIVCRALTLTSRWCDSADRLRRRELPTELQTSRVTCLSTPPADSRTLILNECKLYLHVKRTNHSLSPRHPSWFEIRSVTVVAPFLNIPHVSWHLSSVALDALTPVHSLWGSLHFLNRLFLTTLSSLC